MKSKLLAKVPYYGIHGLTAAKVSETDSEAYAEADWQAVQKKEAPRSSKKFNA